MLAAMRRSRRTLAQAVETLHRLGDAVGEAAALASLGDLAVHDGAYQSAEQSYRHGLESLGNRPGSECAGDCTPALLRRSRDGVGGRFGNRV